MLDRNRIRSATKATLTHFCISVFIGVLVATLIFGLWFPFPYHEIVGGLQLFWILITVDLVCGPLLTAFIFNPYKSRRELTLDLSLIALIQVAAILYGLYSISLARPVAVVFETDRMVVVTAAGTVPAEGKSLAWTGPVFMGTREPKNGQEMLQSIQMSLQGVEPSARPDWWQDYTKSIPQVKSQMKPLEELRSGIAFERQQTLDRSVEKTGRPLEQLHYLPLVSGKNLDDWIALFDGSAQVVGFAPIGGFN